MTNAAATASSRRYVVCTAVLLSTNVNAYPKRRRQSSVINARRRRALTVPAAWSRGVRLASSDIGPHGNMNRDDRERPATMRAGQRLEEKPTANREDRL